MRWVSLARRFESMAREVLAREARLREQVRELRIEIDHARQARQVAEITETDFFRDLSGRAADLRRIIRDGDPNGDGASAKARAGSAPGNTRRLTRYAPLPQVPLETQVVCSNCGTENRAGRKFCSECAAPLALPCPSCGALNEPGEKFCGECAQPLPAGGQAVAPSGLHARTPVSERRLVSILFADLVGFTTLAEGKDAEDTRELLSAYFDLSRDIIARYGGTIEKFIGDAVMAVWGAPVAHEDDAERAVRAALDLVDEVRTLGPTIQARAGVLTGEAAVTIGATNQGMVAGDLVNTASRLQSVAAPGTVLVGEATHRAASNAIAFEEAGEQTLKGKTSPVPAWRALRVVAELGGRNRSETLEAPFVGRDDELRLLKDLFHATGRERRARLVSVIGPAGIGKSRLGWEFSKYTDGVVDTTYWHVGRSPAYGEGISFWALGEMVRRRAGLFETDDETTTRLKITQTLDEYVPDEADRRWIEPALLTLLGIEASTGGSEQLFAAWRTFFERIADQGTVAMVFEDFHYADSGLIDFVDHLLEWSRSVPIFVITLSRPELLERRADWGAGKRNFTSLYLEPLDPGAMRELLAGLVPGLPASAVAADRRPRRRHPPVRGRNGPDARRRGTPDHRRRHLSTGRRPDQPGRS